MTWAWHGGVYKIFKKNTQKKPSDSNSNCKSHNVCLIVLLLQVTRGHSGGVWSGSQGLPGVFYVHLITATVCEWERQAIFDCAQLTFVVVVVVEVLRLCQAYWM